jgi:hypothetical protein
MTDQTDLAGNDLGEPGDSPAHDIHFGVLTRGHMMTVPPERSRDRSERGLADITKRAPHLVGGSLCVVAEVRFELTTKGL